MEDETSLADDAAKSSKLESALRRLTEVVVKEGVGPFVGSEAYAHDRLRRTGDLEKALQRIVTETIASSGVTGLVTGIPGGIAMLATLPANLTSSFALNARMVGAIATLRGYDADDPNVMTAILAIMAGTSPGQAAKLAGVKVGVKAADAGLRALPIGAIRLINKRIGFMLIAKYGTKRAPIVLAKAVPLVGGLVGGSVDATLTATIASLSKKWFPAVAPSATVVQGETSP
ncbi:hypothetical protein GC722_00360 [Auraticoccus sp. F435]|uniref:EcsC family protein n=1 Tax=Auraticoccus cholistanensis TaxID=2656650 RepID=A0A6A9USE4_9ACTN|nr:EcsC family protein [Auraticoccus cholistanensis]MVA74494.1 hypothetical protein [Auraticoccus cholistanensis]